MAPDPSPADPAVLSPTANAGSVVLITGGGTGIGAATAREFARTGAAVVICGRRPEPLALVQSEIEATGGVCLAIPTDVRELNQVEELVDAAIARFGGIDVLVNNAGGQFQAPAEEISPNGWRAVHRLSLDAAWNLTRLVAERTMIPRRRGVVIFVGFSPRRGIPGFAHAGAARAALENLASGLALEWSRYGIRSICVSPGTIATEGLDQYGADLEEWATGIPMRRLGTSSEVAAVIAFLCSPGGAYVTGTTVSRNSVTSAPAENALPCPATTTTRLERTASEASAASRSCSTAVESAFSFSGRCSVNTQTSPRRSTPTRSLITSP